MISYKACSRISSSFIRKFSSKAKPKVNLDEEVNTNINNALFKPRNHPGRIKPTTVELPEDLLKAIESVVDDHPIKTLLDESEPFARKLCCRLPPVEQGQLKQIKKEVYQSVLEKSNKGNISNETDQERFKQSVKDKVNASLRHKVYNWTPVNYNVYNSLLYLFARFAPDYAALVRIFSEINSKNKEFKPRSLFDFGSGTGSVTWAANLYWRKNIFEYFNVDSSGEMNDLAQLLLQGGRGTNQVNLKGTFYRQFLPANSVSYDLVVCAYSLLELPSLRSRLQTVLNLWNKTSQYLVIVEHGTHAGFRVVNEARDFILGIEDKSNIGHVFSPCPHDTICPRFLTDNAACNFQVSYLTLPFAASSIRKERYSYVVLKKGKRDVVDHLQWPRIVETPIVRSKHTICRMCTGSGKLEEVIFTAARHGKTTYHCARSTRWGDCLPIKIEPTEEKS